MSGLAVGTDGAGQSRRTVATAPIRLPGRIRAGLVAGLLALAAAAWVITGLRMAGMGSGPGGELGWLGFYASVWVVMMAAMMFPSVLADGRDLRSGSARAAAGGSPYVRARRDAAVHRGVPAVLDPFGLARLRRAGGRAGAR